MRPGAKATLCTHNQDQEPISDDFASILVFNLLAILLSKRGGGMTRSRQTMPRKSSRSPTEVDKQVGRNVRRYRKDMHMTLNELADQLGVSQQQIQKYETGESRISASMVLGISEVLNIGIEDLFIGTRNQKTSKKSRLETARRECRMWIDRTSSKETLHQMARVLRAMSGKGSMD